MAGRIVRSSGYRSLAWKNGLGVSQVVATQPHGAGYQELDWQVATTRIAASCPFSRLPGLDRHFMVLEGEGVELHFRGANDDPEVRRLVDTPLEACEFRGDWQTECRLLGGPVQVLNLVTRRARCTARVSVVTLRQSMTFDKAADETLLAFVASGACEIEEYPEALAAHDAVVADGAMRERYNMRGQGARVVMARITPVCPANGQ